MIGNILAVIWCILFIALFGYIALQRGVITALREFNTATYAGLNRLCYGPKKPDPKAPYAEDCYIIHSTADAEKELYGEIISGSVRSHMNECKISLEAIKADPPTKPDNCAHEWIDDKRYNTLNRKICEWCGTVRQYQSGGQIEPRKAVHAPLPDSKDQNIDFANQIGHIENQIAILRQIPPPSLGKPLPNPVIKGVPY
jgi:hypothetical protein